MSKRKEKISAFLDNDMHQDELMSFSLSAEAEDAAVAQRYQMIGDALRGELSDSSFVDVSHAVREAIAGDSSLTAGAAAANHAAVNRSPRGAGSRPVQATASWDVFSWFKPVAGLAVAVMVALVVVLSVSQQDDGSLAPLASNSGIRTGDAQPAVQSAAVANGVQAPAGTAISDTMISNAVVSDGVISNTAADKKAVNIDPYINQHLEYATQDALQGRLPYVRAVNYETEK